MTVAPVVQKESASVKILVTAGNLRNGHVYLRDVLWFFPKDAIRGKGPGQGEVLPCTLELAGLATVETDIDPDKGIFRWRGWKRFFRIHEVLENDAIVFTRLDRHRFSVMVEHQRLEGISPEVVPPEGTPMPSRSRAQHRCNDLSGDEWLRSSLSIWSDIRKSSDELALGHPAMFPAMLCERFELGRDPCPPSAA